MDIVVTASRDLDEVALRGRVHRLLDGSVVAHRWTGQANGVKFLTACGAAAQGR
jgi:hypothetical protein